jgi:hypothetical protein
LNASDYDERLEERSALTSEILDAAQMLPPETYTEVKLLVQSKYAQLPKLLAHL